ncbi:hypothetical protein NDU88_005586 [Pleurodeles waltl]|uniref:Uncharacterized protein n=1 Tax=Pleurodeles waltl TaxID=8319 RepID=A0AAV7NPG1_PLEWA|nr:hypothetical protein NDU88_005586 [Pleurodeles waltl]
MRIPANRHTLRGLSTIPNPDHEETEPCGCRPNTTQGPRAGGPGIQLVPSGLGTAATPLGANLSAMVTALSIEVEAMAGNAAAGSLVGVAYASSMGLRESETRA